MNLKRNDVRCVSFSFGYCDISVADTIGSIRGSGIQVFIKILGNIHGNEGAVTQIINYMATSAY